MEKRAPDKRRVTLALLTALAFSAAALVETSNAVLSHGGAWRAIAAVGYAGVAVLWFVIYSSWKKEARD